MALAKFTKGEYRVGATNWNQSVAGVCVRENRVLLARHTYGGGKGKLIIPGGYVEVGESPQDALRREFMEETGVAVEPMDVLGIRFNSSEWYVVFSAGYVSGEARSDGNENSEVVWLDMAEALTRSDVPELTKRMIRAYSRTHFVLTPYTSGNSSSSLYCAQ